MLVKFTPIFMAMVAGAMAFSAPTYAKDAILDAAQKTQMESIIHDYILKNPQVILESVQNMQKAQMEMSQQKVEQAALKNASALFNQSGDPVVGDANGKVTLVEFFDYQCPHCVDMAAAMEALVKANPTLRVVFKEFPIRGQTSVVAAKAALAANMQGKYWQFHQLLMKNASTLTPANIVTLAGTAGLDVEKLKKDMEGSAVDAQIKATYKLAKDLNLMGTPALFAAKTKNPTAIQFIPGQTDQAFLQKTVDKAGS
jgi:protein-disulfide isomerase